MVNFEKIVVGVNFTESSSRALLQAHYFSQKEGAELVAVYCLDTKKFDKLREHHEIDTTPMVNNALKNLQKYVQQVLGDDHGVTLQVVEGAPYQELISFAENISADLLVLGTNEYEENYSSSGIVTIKCVRKASIPVLLVKSRENHKHEKVLVYTDMSHVSRSLIAHAAKCSADLEDDLDVVYFVSPPWLISSDIAKNMYLTNDENYKAEYRAAIREQLRTDVNQATEDLQVSTNKVIIESEHCPQEMIEYLDSHDVDLVVIGKTGEGANVTNHPLGAIAEHILRRAACSVLVVPQV